MYNPLLISKENLIVYFCIQNLTYNNLTLHACPLDERGKLNETSKTIIVKFFFKP